MSTLPKKLVIIGNGFDLSHGLPTQYSSFKDYLEKNYNSFFATLSKYFPNDPLWNSFEEALAELDYSEIEDENSCYLIGYGDENWRDSANHDYQYMIEESLSFAIKIPDYLKKWICTIDTNASPTLSNPIIDKNNLYINFNYTDTLEKVYNIPESNIIYIHGKALRGDKLIIGHHYLDQMISKLQYKSDDFRIAEGKERIISYFRTTYKDTTTIISKNKSFFDSLSQIDELFIYGHSLSDIDYEYFETINKCVPKNCLWHIFYHDTADQQRALYLLQELGIVNYTLYSTKQK